MALTKNQKIGTVIGIAIVIAIIYFWNDIMNVFSNTSKTPADGSKCTTTPVAPALTGVPGKYKNGVCVADTQSTMGPFTTNIKNPCVCSDGSVHYSVPAGSRCNSLCAGDL